MLFESGLGLTLHAASVLPFASSLSSDTAFQHFLRSHHQFFEEFERFVTRRSAGFEQQAVLFQNRTLCFCEGRPRAERRLRLNRDSHRFWPGLKFGDAEPCRCELQAGFSEK